VKLSDTAAANASYSGRDAGIGDHAHGQGTRIGQRREGDARVAGCRHHRHQLIDPASGQVQRLGGAPHVGGEGVHQPLMLDEQTEQSDPVQQAEHRAQRRGGRRAYG
jgi:hypothetical protein